MVATLRSSNGAVLQGHLGLTGRDEVFQVAPCGHPRELDQLGALRSRQRLVGVAQRPLDELGGLGADALGVGLGTGGTDAENAVDFGLIGGFGFCQAAMRAGIVLKAVAEVLMSSSTRSGRSSAVARSACWPVCATPATVNPAVRCTKPVCTRATMKSSSTMSTRIIRGQLRLRSAGAR